MRGWEGDTLGDMCFPPVSNIAEEAFFVDKHIVINWVVFLAVVLSVG